MGIGHRITNRCMMRTDKNIDKIIHREMEDEHYGKNYTDSMKKCAGRICTGVCTF